MKKSVGVVAVAIACVGVPAGAVGCSAGVSVSPAVSAGPDQAALTARETSKEAALAVAKRYAVDQVMSQARVFDLLTAENGEGFTDEAARYAVEHVEVDWNENALKRAMGYLGTGMTVAQIREQLTASYGEQFTEEEADYAIARLNG